MFRYKLILSITAVACVFVLMSGPKVSAAKDNTSADISGMGVEVELSLNCINELQCLFLCHCFRL